MPSYPRGVRRWVAGVAGLAIPVAIALIPMQAALADDATSTVTSTTSTITSATSTPTTSTTTTTTKSTTSGLGLSSFTNKLSTAQPASTSSGSSDCSGNLVCTDGATVTLDSSNGPNASICSLYLGGSAVQSPSGGCDNGNTTASGNIALALGRTNVNLGADNNVIEADTCGLALALDMNNPSTASVICGSAPGLGATSVNQANILALLGPSQLALSQNGDLSTDVCGAAAALGMDDTKTNADVYCETLSSAQNWEATVPATTLTVGDDILAADIQKTFADVDLNNGIFVTICNVDVQLGGQSVGPIFPTGQINVDVPFGSNPGPAVNCSPDANQNPIISNGAVNLTVGDTGAGGGTGEGAVAGGTCGAGGGASSSSGSTTNSCGTSNPPPGYQAVPGPSNGATSNGNIAVVLGQNNANFGPNSGPGGTGDFGGQANACGGAGSGDPNGGSASTKCQTVTFVKSNTQVKGATSPPSKPPANAAGPAKLAQTGFPLLTGLLGIILISVGCLEAFRRRGVNGQS